MRVANGFTVGNVIWVEHKVTGDVFHRVKVVFERQPGETEFCKVCHKGKLSVLGHIVQYGILDDQIYAVAYCDHCCGFTAFSYHVEHLDRYLPEEAGCDDQQE
jgi:hypothetical protein